MPNGINNLQPGSLLTVTVPAASTTNLKLVETNLKHFLAHNPSAHNGFQLRSLSNLKHPRMGRGQQCERAWPPRANKNEKDRTFHHAQPACLKSKTANRKSKIQSSRTHSDLSKKTFLRARRSNR